jgi:hypothetical protein
VLYDRALEIRVVRNEHAIWIGRGFDDCWRHRFAGQPKLHRIIIDRVGDAPNIGARVSRVAGGSHLAQIEKRARLGIDDHGFHGASLSTEGTGA